MHRLILFSCLVTFACLVNTAHGQRFCSSIDDCIRVPFCRDSINTVCENGRCFCRQFQGNFGRPVDPRYPQDIATNTCVDDFQCQTLCGNRVGCCDSQRRCQCAGQCYPTPLQGGGAIIRP